MALLEALAVVSEKAANIARLCRQEEHLFELLVEEKGNCESNPRFVQDFKTLADVLIQETARNDIGKQFPEIADFIRGEESNTFCNALGESVCVKIRDDVTETADLLKIVLNGDERAAKLLAEEVHRDIPKESVPTCNGLPETCEFPDDYRDLGVWIDPIDSTAEYISGKDVVENSIHVSGLRCVTVLIGVFTRITGVPLIGIINQPFYEHVQNRWRGRCHWGLRAMEENRAFHCCSISDIANPKYVCLSSSEDDVIKSKLKSKGFQLIEASGAGYKLLSVITGQVGAYVLSKSTTFKWDTCGPQAILRSLGGDVLKFNDALNRSSSSLDYAENAQNEEHSETKISLYCNHGGIIAYRDKLVCDEILKVLSS